MAKSPINRRKHVIVEPATQALMMLRWACLPLSVLISGAIGMLMVGNTAIEQIKILGGTPPSFAQLVASTVVIVVGVTVMVAWMALQQSHRIVGPARKLRQSIERIREGDLDFEVSLRDHDELSVIADELNLLIATLRQRGATGPADDTQASGEPSERDHTADSRQVESAGSAV